MSTYIANIKVTSKEVIKNWWKLNYFTGGSIPVEISLELVFVDSGDGDMDFYSYWYSICYLVGMLNIYRYVFRDIDSYDEMVRRFLKSREIAFSNDSDSYLLDYLYKYWREEVSKRGTKQIDNYIGKSDEVGLNMYELTEDIESDINNNSGIGIVGSSCSLDSSIYLGFFHCIEFDILLKNGDTLLTVDGDLFYRTLSSCFIHIEKISDPDENNVGVYGISYNCYTNVLTYNASLDVTIVNNVKFIRVGTNIYLYINGELISSIVVSTVNAYTFIHLFNGSLPVLANLRVTKYNSDYTIDDVYQWKCNEGSGFILDSNKAPLYPGVLGVTVDGVWDNNWVRNVGFNNIDYVRVDGEIRRLINYIDGECLTELIKSSELGLTIDVSSPISQEASCVNLNKSYEKGVINRLSRYPLLWTNNIKPIISNGYIQYSLDFENPGVFGLNTVDAMTLDSYKPNTLLPFCPIPIATDSDDISGYEISFVIKTDASINLQFGIKTLDVDFNEVDKTKKYSDDTASNMFIEDTLFSLCNGRDLWIRGVYSLIKLPDVADTLNINIGSNLYNDSQNEVKYLMPVINFYCSGLGAVVNIKDIVVRPLSLNTSKGMIDNKNKMICFLKNNSGMSDEYIKDFIDEKLIPYNCSTNIQFI